LGIPHLSTTHPSARTDQQASHGRATKIRWGFPRSATTPLIGRQILGRDPSCDTICEGNEVSRRHAEVYVDGPISAIRDLESRNGTFVNGRRVDHAPLTRGDVVRCGEWIGVVVVEPVGSAGGFRELAPGWWGGATLREACEPALAVPADVPIIIQGETGSGKEGMAQLIHASSGRRGPLVPLNCAALPADLAEAELFGHRKGAFTGAQEASVGLFRAAEGGTLFLDEILDLPIALQAKLLRALEAKAVRGVGETRDVPIDVRIVAATQEPLALATEERRFRADLHARLDGLTVVLPPLRERREDIAPLFLELTRARAGEASPVIEAKLVESLCLYDWPLNVRELLQLARRLVAVRGIGPLRRSDLPERMRAQAGDSPPAPTGEADGPQRRPTDDEAEFEALLVALRNHAGSVGRAAAAVGISRYRAYRLLNARPDFSLDDVRGT
jgi:transcriptional regulator with AAA-type ATPase domain